jgi:hypothetical protein
LLYIAEQLVAVLQRFIPRAVKFAARSFALDEEQRAGVIVANENVGATAAGTVTDLPFGLQLNVLRQVAFF